MVRALCLLLLVFCTVAAAHGEALDVGSPEAAFAGGPIQLSPHAAALLRARYHGDKVPEISQPFRRLLDAAMLGRDWKRVEAVKRQLAKKDGMAAALLWEQTRLIATGSIAVAEMGARDVAATGSPVLAETAVMMWLYAVAVSMTDGEKCASSAARDAHLDRLRGPEYAPVIQLLRDLGDDRVAAMRDLAIRLETALAEDRTDDSMCREGTESPAIKSAAVWRPEALAARAMLPRDLAALTTVMRGKTGIKSAVQH